MTEFIPAPMELNGVSVGQEWSDPVEPGDDCARLLTLTTSTTGSLDPLALEAVSVGLKGCGPHVASVKLLDGDRVAASAEVTPGADAVRLVPAPAIVLPEQDASFDIAYELKGDKPPFDIDAEVTSVTIGGSEIPVAGGDPEGSRKVSNIYIFKGNGEAVVDSPMKFFDAGGPSGTYARTPKGAVTFTPPAGMMLRASFGTLSLALNDRLRVYQGAGTDADRLLSELSGTRYDLPDILSYADDGSLTFEFNPTGSGSEGWEIELIPFVPLAAAGVAVTDLGAATVTRGAGGVPVARVALTVDGIKGNIDLTGMDFGGGAEAAEAWTLLASSTRDDMAGATVYARGQTPAFTGSYPIDRPGTYYFWLTADISAEAPTGARIEPATPAVTVSGASVPADGAIAAITVADGFHGTLRVGPSSLADYPTLPDALAAIAGGIDGPVEIIMEPGLYEGRVTVGLIPGMSARNTLTVRSADRDAESVIIHSDDHIELPPSADREQLESGVITIDGATYFSLEDVTVSTANSDFPGVIHIKNLSDNCAVRRCILRAPVSLSYTAPVNLINMYAEPKRYGAGSNCLTVAGCRLEGGFYGVHAGGNYISGVPSEHGLRLTDNTFSGQGVSAIYISEELDAIISGNTIVHDGSAITAGYSDPEFQAVFLNRAYGAVFESNVIAMKAPRAGSQALNVALTIPAADGAHLRIFNNEINISAVDVSTYSEVIGINLLRGNSDIDIVANTVRLDGPSGDGIALKLCNEMPRTTVVGNILQNLTPGAVYSLYSEACLPVTLRSNVCYASTPSHIAYAGYDELTYDEWVATAGETAGAEARVEFLSDEVLEPALELPVRGETFDYLTTDLNGTMRGEHPTPGCYEYSASTAAPALTAPVNVSEIGYESAVLNVSADLTCNASLLVLPAGQQAPEAADMAEATPYIVRASRVNSLRAGKLTPHTTYVPYLLLTSLRGTASEVIAGPAFTTAYAPTETATFEEHAVTEADGAILDGTARFEGFRIVERQGGHRAAMTGSTATITTTNGPDMTIDGVFLLCSAPVKLTASSGTSKTVGIKETPTYVNLRDMGPVTTLVMETAAGADVEIDDFAGQPLPLAVTAAAATERIDAGHEAIITADAAGGVEPFAYEWSDHSGLICGDSSVLTASPASSVTYRVTVTDAWGRTASRYVQQAVTGEPAIARFDDLYLPGDDTFWNGYTDVQGATSGTFFSGSYEFGCAHSLATASWSGFAYANSPEDSFTGNFAVQQFRSAAGGGADGSASYGVVYATTQSGAAPMGVSHAPDGDVVPGAWVTNSAWVKDAVAHGDGMSGPFVKDDLFVLRATGFLGHSATGTILFPLADFTAEREADRYCLDTWQWLDLSPLGKVTEIDFDLIGTKTNTMGLTTPAYFCIDGIGAAMPVTEGEPARADVADPGIDLRPYFSFDGSDGAGVTYSIVSGEATVSGHYAVMAGGAEGASHTIVVCATSRGRREYVRIPVTYTSGLQVAAAADVTVGPNPATDVLCIRGAEGAGAALYAADGSLILTADCVDSTEHIDISGIPAGVYLLILDSTDARRVFRIIVTR